MIAHHMYQETNYFSDERTFDSFGLSLCGAIRFLTCFDEFDKLRVVFRE